MSLADTRYKISRKVGLRSDSSTTDLLSTQSSGDNAQSPCALQFPAGSALCASRIFSPILPFEAGVNIWQLSPETIWWDSKIRSLAPDPGSSSNEKTRLLMLYLNVIYPITHSFYKLDDSKDRSWMLTRLISKPALHFSALSISACFDYSLSQPPRINDIGICPKVRGLQSRAVRELQVEIDRFASMERSPVEELVWAGAQMLDVIIHLQTLEIFSMLQGHWEMHHQAARRVLNHVEGQAPEMNEDSTPKLSIIEIALRSWSLSNERRRHSLEFSITNFIWIDVLAISTFGVSNYVPCAFDYLSLLQAEIIKPQAIMGCQGWIMACIVKIARLEYWKLNQQSQIHAFDINSELAQRSEQLAAELTSGIERLERGNLGADASILEEDSRLVSTIWAYGAQVLRQVITSDMEPARPDMDQEFVDACLQKLEALPTRLFMRTSWPYTVAGCMSSSESQHARFRWILGRTLQEAQPPGISWKGLIVMEECWKLRQMEGNRKFGWREAMESLGARVVLT
ncbi:hypothetical protein MMC13_005411 [Lambiella insularis]|nr:hypothetical protein [Lambiella insularis]